MKVLLISPQPPPPGGIATWTKNIFDYLSVRPGDIKILYQDTSLKYRDLLDKSFISRLYFGLREAIKILNDLKKNIRDFSPDIIHLASSASLALFKDYLILRIAKKKGIPLIIHWHFGRITSLFESNNWEWKLLSTIIRGCQTSIVIDSKSYNTLVKSGFTNIANIPNPISLDLEQKIRQTVNETKHIDHGRLIFVGHIINTKGVFELVEACTQIQGISELSLIGPPDHSVKEELIKIAGNRNNGIWLRFYGSLSNDEVFTEIQKSQALILPSYTEGFPLVVLEAMAMGCAVVATEVGAIPEMLAINSDSPCGICVAVKNVEQLKSAIVTLLNEPDKAELLGNNGISRVLNNYTMERVIEHYISLWKEAI